jgi:hypothetical protein
MSRCTIDVTPPFLLITAYLSSVAPSLYIFEEEGGWQYGGGWWSRPRSRRLPSLSVRRPLAVLWFDAVARRGTLSWTPRA